MYITIFLQKIIVTVIYFDTVLKQTDKYVHHHLEPEIYALG